MEVDDVGSDDSRTSANLGAGAARRLIGVRSGSVIIALCRSDGGEEVDRLVSSDDQLVAYVTDRSTDKVTVGWRRPLAMRRVAETLAGFGQAIDVARGQRRTCRSLDVNASSN